METKYDIKKTSKNSLEDLLDIRKKNVRTDWEGHSKKIRVYHEEFDKIISEPFYEISVYIHKVFSYYNYSQIIDKLISPKKESKDNIEKLCALWIYYIQKNLVIHKEKFDTFSKKIIYVFTSFINKYLIHIFSIPKIAECLNILNKKTTFKIYNFNDENDEKDNEIYLDIEKELKGNGCTFIFLKELKRLYDCLVFSSYCLKDTAFHFLFGIEHISEYIFYKYVIENEVVSTLMRQIKLIFELNLNNKEVMDFINKFNVELKNEVENNIKFKEKIEELYSKEDEMRYVKFFKQEYEEICKYKLNEIPKKAKFIYKEIKDLEKDYKLNGDEIEYEEDEKIKEITDIDELTKYIQGDEKKKKKKKKKKKENPINMLEKLKLRGENNLEDDQISIYSHDTIFSNFKEDIRNDNIDNKNAIKTKPIISDEFIENLK